MCISFSLSLSLSGYLVLPNLYLQEKIYNGATLFTPVVGDLFGVIPETPEQMLSAEADLVAVPAIFGFTTDDGAWLVQDPDSDGVTFQEFRNQLRAAIKGNFRPSERDAVFKRVMGVYLPDGPAKLNPLQLREVLIRYHIKFLTFTSNTLDKLFSNVPSLRPLKDFKEKKTKRKILKALLEGNDFEKSSAGQGGFIKVGQTLARMGSHNKVKG